MNNLRIVPSDYFRVLTLLTKSLNYLLEGSLESIGTLDKVTTYHRTQSHTHSGGMDNLEMPIRLKHMSFYWRRKPENLEEATEEQDDHANAAHTVKCAKPLSIEVSLVLLIFLAMTSSDFGLLIRGLRFKPQHCQDSMLGH